MTSDVRTANAMIAAEVGPEGQPGLAGSAWPDPPAREAFYGLAGDIVEVISPHTEADPVAILTSTLVAAGSAIGRGPHFLAESDRHYTNINAALVGASAKGRKGSSWGRIRHLMQLVDESWTASESNLSSGEGLIWAVRDSIEEQVPVKEKGRVVDYEQVVKDQGVEDKRLLVVATEFASALRVMRREGNTLSPIVRQAWDTGNLRVITKHSPAQATGAHISILAHITRDELLRTLDDTEVGNGFANRFLWLCVRRARILPEGGSVPERPMELLAERLHRAITFAAHIGTMVRDEHARTVWHRVYPDLSEGKPGLFGSMTSRAEAQVMRLACIYALLDESAVVQAPHLLAALALWEYVEASALFIFGDRMGDPVADAVLEAIRQQPVGLTRTEISSLFGRHESASRISRALESLEALAQVRKAVEDTGGRPLERWVAV